MTLSDLQKWSLTLDSACSSYSLKCPFCGTQCSCLLLFHGMEVNALQLVFKSVFLGKMTYAVSAWWGYTTATDKQRLEALIRRAVCVGLYPADRPNLHQLVADMDDALFARIQTNKQHVLQQLLPAHTCYKYVLRSRRHNYTLSIKTDHDDLNFITRLLYKDMY